MSLTDASGRAHPITYADGSQRFMVPYEDFDGISLIACRNALLTRYRDHDLNLVSDNDIFTASVAANPTKTLTQLMSAREVAAWGTQQAPGACLAVLSFTPFTEEELADNDIKSTLDAGCITLTGELYVGAWHTFTYGADYAHGELACPRVTLPEGTYRVTVHRPFRKDEERESLEGTTFLIHLERTDAEHVSASVEEVPGADGWL